jgi:tetratricopeptide (TPR) repeat protein
VSEKLKVCKYCGKENPADAIFCLQCGSRFNVEENFSSSRKTNSNNSNKKELDVKWLYLLIAVLLIGGVVILYFAGVFSSPKVVVKQTKTTVTQSQAVQSPQVVDLKTAQELKKMEDAVAANPANLELALQLANKFYDVGEFNKAIVYYLKYVSINKNNPNVLVDLGTSYYYNGQFDEAEKYLLKALEINPEHQIALLNIGVVKKAMGDVELAKEYWNKAYTIAPNSTVGKKAEQFLVNN